MQAIRTSSSALRSSSATRRSVLSAYKLILRSLERGQLGKSTSQALNRGLVVDAEGRPVILGYMDSEPDEADDAGGRLPSLGLGTASEEWREEVRRLFRSAVVDTGGDRGFRSSWEREQRRLAREYAEMVSSVHLHERLLRMHGWGIKRDQKSQVAGVARRVGLQVPEGEAAYGEEAFADSEVDSVERMVRKLSRQR